MDLLIATLKLRLMLSQPVTEAQVQLQLQVVAFIIYQIAYKMLVIITGAVQSEKEPLPSHTAGNRVLHHQMNSPLMLIESFLQALTNADKDGRIVIARKGTARY